MNQFKLYGACVSYGSSEDKDWVDIQPKDGGYSIQVYLSDEIKLSDLERKYILQEHDISATGYIQSKSDDTILLIATQILIK